ncbi:nucleotide-binding protein, partial [Chryseobacterium sp.]|uniref:nucleotide-binding protein n=1 Tax=Chryseobacterium sp. TaxID=1871047 RepID=UPI0024E21D4B
MKPNIFIGSSVESLGIAYNVQQLLEHDCDPTVWTQGIFNLSNTGIESLIKALNNFDYAIFIFKPDDISNIKRENYNVIRDNVIFELGLFIGKLGRENVFFVVPKDTENLHLPSDLNGINHGTYDPNRSDGNTLAALGPFC